MVLLRFPSLGNPESASASPEYEILFRHETGISVDVPLWPHCASLPVRDRRSLKGSRAGAREILPVGRLRGAIRSADTDNAVL